MICKPCRNGQHPHDRWTGNATTPGVRAGDDAGCPNLAVPGDLNRECTCAVVLPPLPSKGRRHCPTCRCEED